MEIRSQDIIRTPDKQFHAGNVFIQQHLQIDSNATPAQIIPWD